MNTVGSAASGASSSGTRVARRRHQVGGRDDHVLGLAAPRLLAQHLEVGAEVVAPGEAGGAAAARQARVHEHAIALAELRQRRHAAPSADDHAADVAARDVRKRDLQRRQPPAQPQIDVVQRRRR